MLINMGVVFALVALFGWGFGDFFIQKSTREMGWYKALFTIGIAGFVGLMPFALKDISRIGNGYTFPLIALSVIILIYAWALFEALRKGKLSVVESVVAIDLPFTVSLAFLFGGESITLAQGLLFGLICVGIVLAATKEFSHFKSKRTYLEKGVLLAFLGSFFSALTNFYIGSFSHVLPPLLIIWFTHSMLALICGVYISVKGEWREFKKEVLDKPLGTFATAAFDNVAWVGYASATSLIPTSLAITMSESYIVVAALLGWLFGHERLRRHQVIGAAIAFIGVGILSTTI